MFKYLLCFRFFLFLFLIQFHQLLFDLVSKTLMIKWFGLALVISLIAKHCIDINVNAAARSYSTIVALAL